MKVSFNGVYLLGFCNNNVRNNVFELLDAKRYSIYYNNLENYPDMVKYKDNKILIRTGVDAKEANELHKINFGKEGTKCINCGLFEDAVNDAYARKALFVDLRNVSAKSLYCRQNCEKCSGD